jgi:hypothetical protein
MQTSGFSHPITSFCACFTYYAMHANWFDLSSFCCSSRKVMLPYLPLLAILTSAALMPAPGKHKLWRRTIRVGGCLRHWCQHPGSTSYERWLLGLVAGGLRTIRVGGRRVATHLFILFPYQSWLFKTLIFYSKKKNPGILFARGICGVPVFFSAKLWVSHARTIAHHVFFLKMEGGVKKCLLDGRLYVCL